MSFLEGFCETLRVDRTSIVAHGVSGAVAVQFAASHPRLVDRIVLESTGFLLASDGIGILNPVTRAEARDLQRYTRLAGTDASADQLWADSLVCAAVNQALIDSAPADAIVTSALLKQIIQPTLVIWGRDDQLTPIETGERVHAAIPNSQMVIVEKTRHAPHREQPVEFSAVVEKFLSGAKVHQRFRKQRQEENVWF